MEIVGIIFYVIIFVVFASAKKAAQSGKETKKSHNWSKTLGNYTGQIVNMSTKSATEKSGHEKKMTSNVLQNERTAIPNVSKNEKTVIPNVPRKKKSERTFMEPHKEEKIQPQIRTNNLWGEDAYAGQRIVALRLMEGDTVPEGYVRIKCPYCGADNLVTKKCKQYHSCYFCRVPID